MYVCVNELVQIWLSCDIVITSVSLMLLTKPPNLSQKHVDI